MRFQVPDLPVMSFLPRIRDALSAGPLVLVAETGAGKTTALPAALAASGGIKGRIVVLEPRRLAARSAAAWAAGLLGERVGGTVGYRVRGDSRVGPGTVVEYVTEAVFLRMVQDDPLLEGIGLAVFDEFHERSLVSDLSLAFAAEAAGARPGLSLLVMSATMDSGDVRAYLSCPALDVPGRTYPVGVEYRPPGTGRGVEETVAAVALEALASCDGDVLAFLPGSAEAARCAQALARSGSPAGTVFLHGSMPLDAQVRVLDPPAGTARRIVLATAVAETSLTVPRVRAVVDSGLSRFTRFHLGSGMNRLVTERVSRAQAEQRRGRAGRLGPGTCWRCWDPTDILQPSRGPELARSELSSLVLECALRGVRERLSLRWLDEPPQPAWEAGRNLLLDLGLIAADGTITPRGARAASLGTDTRPAAALVAAADDSRDPAMVHAAALAAAVMEGRGTGERTPDLRSALDELLSGRAGDRGRPALDEADRLCRRVLGRGFDRAAAASRLELAGDALAAGFPDRLARLAPDGFREFRSGRKARAGGAAESVAGWLLATDLDAGDSLVSVRQALPVSDAAARAALLPSAAETVELEWRGLSCVAWSRLKSGAFTLRERRLPEPPPGSLAGAVRGRLSSEGTAWLPWDDGTAAFLSRLRYALRAGRLPGVDPVAWTEAGLAAAMPDALEPWLSAKGDAIAPAGLAGALRDLLGREAVAVLEREAPEFVTTPGGRRRRPAYPPAGEARLSLRIQEAFGMRDSPRICGRPLVLELLSPADRPLQVSSDLASFWAGAYPALRGELSRRYPRHHWPEDPLSAAPGRGPAPRRS